MTAIILISVVVIAFLSLISYWFYFRNRKLTKMYKMLAAKYDFNINFKKQHRFLNYPRVSGIYRKRNIDIGSFDKSDNNKNTPHTYIKVSSASNTDFSFIIQKRTKKNKLLSSGRDVFVDEKDFKKNFIVMANDNEMMKKILDYTIRFKFIQAAKIRYNGEMLLLGGEIMYIEKGLMLSDRELMKIELLLHGMCDLCDDIEQYTVVQNEILYK